MPRHPFVAALITGLFLGSTATSAFAAWSHDPTVNNVVCNSYFSQYNVTIAPDGAGGAFLAWSDARTGLGHDVYAQHLNATGSPLWSAGGVLVCGASADQGIPAVLPDGAGGLFVAWQDYRSGNSNSDIFVQHVTAAGGLAFPANGYGCCTAANSQYDAHLVSDNAGGAFVAWLDQRQGSSTSVDIYMQRFNAAGGIYFVTNGVGVATSANLSRSNLRLIADGASGAIASWHESRPPYLTEIMAQRVSSAGTMSWTPNGLAVSGNQASDQWNADLCSDGAGGAYFAWSDGRGAAPYDIYAQHITSLGASGWSSTGLAVCTATNSQSEPRIASDGSGGAVFAWSDNRSATGGSIYCQRLTADGLAYWAADGYAACVTSGSRNINAIVSDGAGGAIVQWLDGRAPFGWDLYAQRIAYSGYSLWSTNGLAVTTAAGSPGTVALCGDGAGGMISAWIDNRAATALIYAQRVERYGQLGNPEPTITRVRDLPNDQGGQLKVSWDASYLDADPLFGIYEYRVFRSAPLVALNTAAARRGLTTDSDEAVHEGKLLALPTATGATIYWEYVGSQLAEALPGYSKVVATTSDSVSGSNPRTYFMVEARASTAASSDRWSSAPDSGYSVDNLAPAAPAPLTGQYLAGTTRLHWSRNTEADLAGYRVYRGSSVAFTPSPATLVGAAPDTGFADAAGAPYVYKVTAVDEHGNESPVATLVPSGTLGVDVTPAAALDFAAPSPNPARGTATLRWTLPHAGAVRVALYDAAGRRVAMVADGVMPAGAHSATLDLRDARGRALAAGLYLARFEAEGRTLTRRLAVVR